MTNTKYTHIYALANVGERADKLKIHVPFLMMAERLKYVVNL
jgi:hypothetical protein